METMDTKNVMSALARQSPQSSRLHSRDVPPHSPWRPLVTAPYGTGRTRRPRPRRSGRARRRRRRFTRRCRGRSRRRRARPGGRQTRGILSACLWDLAVVLGLLSRWTAVTKCCPGGSARNGTKLNLVDQFHIVQLISANLGL